MLKSVLVPLDGSDLSEHSLTLAGEVSRAAGASVHLVHVHVPYEPEQLLSNSSFQWEGVDLTEYDEQHQRDERAYLATVEGRFRQQGLPVDSILLDGEPVADRLASYATEVETDLIVMTSHGRSGVPRVWYGSMADDMIRRASAPVLLVHQEPRTGAIRDGGSIRHILVPLDGSELAERVLRPASELAAAMDARITVAHVVTRGTGLAPRLRPVVEDQRELDRVWGYLDRMVESVGGDGLDVRSHVAWEKMPARGIAEMASTLHADLIAMATHGHGGWRRAVLGSVADSVVRESSLPLLVMRPAEA